MNNKGSSQPGPVFYERRGGEWVQKDGTEERRSVNDALHVADHSCVHEWGPYKGPIHAFYTNPPRKYYVCLKCFVQTTSHVIIPMIYNANPACNHTFANDPRLGPSYSQYEACTKCGEQKIKNL